MYLSKFFQSSYSILKIIDHCNKYSRILQFLELLYSFRRQKECGQLDCVLILESNLDSPVGVGEVILYP